MKKLIIPLIMTVVLAGCGASVQTPEAPESAPPAEEAQSTESDAGDGAETEEEQQFELPQVSEDVVTDEGFDQFAPPEKGETVAIMTTNMGVIKLKFFPEDAPKAVENFVTHSKNGYYDGLTFHRILNNFMLQGGDPDGTGRGGESIWGGPFEDEFAARLHNYRGALSMANSGPDTNGSQFFIVQAGPSAVEPTLELLRMLSEYEEALYPDYRTGQVVSGAQRFTQNAVDNYTSVGGTPWLDGGFPSDAGYVAGHTVFGQVYEGMETVDAIAAVAVDDQGMPSEPVIIEKIEITEY